MLATSSFPTSYPLAPAPPAQAEHTSLLTLALPEIPKLDLESYIQNYRGTWSSLVLCVCIPTNLLLQAGPGSTDCSQSPERQRSLASMR